MSDLFTCQRILNGAHEGEKVASTAESGLLVAATSEGVADLEQFSILETTEEGRQAEKTLSSQKKQEHFFLSSECIFVAALRGLSP